MNNKKAFLKHNFLNSLKSPLFYIVAILFTVFLSVNYYIRQQFFTGNGTSDLLLFFSAVPYVSIIIIPALCFKHSFIVYDSFIPLNSFTKLLLSYFSRLFLFGIMVLLLLPGCLLVTLFGTIDAGQLFTSLLCLIFYGAAVISVCSFIETIITNKISALVVQALVLAIFNSAHLFAVYLPLPAILTTVCKQLSFAWHFDAAGKGIIDTRDILWLSGTSALFLFLSDYVTQKKAGKPYCTGEKGHFTATVLLSMLIMLNGARWFTRIDLSQNKTYSPSRYTKQLLSYVEEPLKITYYRSSTISKLYPQIRDVSDFLTEYVTLNKKVSLIIQDPDKNSSVKTLLENYGIQTQQFRSVTGTSTEYTNVYSAIVIEYQGNVETIPFTMSANTLEYDLDGRVKHLITGKARTVNIVTGNGLSLSDDYNYLIPWLNSQGFICNPLYIEDPSFIQVLERCTGPLMVIGDSEINIEAAIAIENYILKNQGNGLFMVNPYSSNIEENWYITASRRTNIVEMLENWGIRFKTEIAADISCARIQMYDEDNTHTQIINYPLWPSLLQQENAPAGLTLFWATPLELSENAEPYLLSTPAAYGIGIDKNSPENLIETNPFVLETANFSDKEKGTLCLAARITGPLKGLYNLASTDHSEIIVIPDQYFVNSLMTGYIGGDYGDYRNFEFLTSTLLKLNGEEDLAVLQSRSIRDTSLFKVTSIQQFQMLKLITFLVLFVLQPVLIILAGVILNVKKNK